MISQGEATVVREKKNYYKQGTSRIEPETSRSAVECSTTELYPQYIVS